MGAPPSSGGANVLLLGNASDHHANIGLLEHRNFAVTRIEDPAKFDEVHGDPFCGIAVGPSWWGAIPPPEHESQLARILANSTIPWMRIDVSALDSSAAGALNEIVRRTYGAERSAAMLCHGSGCDITSADLDSIGRVNAILASLGRIGFHPAEISVEEARLLQASIVSHVRDTRGVVPTLERMAIRFVHGGLSGARVAIATPDDRGMPIVVKLGDVSMMRQEVQRYSFVARWQGGGASPQLHFHNRCALLLVPLVDDGEEGAARTLGDAVQEVVYGDLSSAPKNAIFDTTVSCVTHALRRIAKLSASPFESGSPRNLGEFFQKSLTGRRILVGGSDIGTILAKATARVATLDGRATVHGDLHLGNILVRGDAPSFIDFGQAGAGHPAQDIAKLDSQIWFRAFRLSEDVASLAALLRASFSGRSANELASQFPWITMFAANQLCVASNSVAREEALKVVRQYGGGIGDIAAMYIVYAVGELLATPASAPVAIAFVSALAQFL